MSPADDREVGVTVRMSPAQHELLKARAASEHRSISQELRRMIELHLADEHRAAA